MLFKASNQIGGNAGIEAVVYAADDIDKPVLIESAHLFLQFVVYFVVIPQGAYYLLIINKVQRQTLEGREDRVPCEQLPEA